MDPAHFPTKNILNKDKEKEKRKEKGMMADRKKGGRGRRKGKGKRRERGRGNLHHRLSLPDKFEPVQLNNKISTFNTKKGFTLVQLDKK